MAFVIIYLPTAEVVYGTRSYTTRQSAIRFIKTHAFRFNSLGRIYSRHTYPGISKAIPKYLLDAVEVSDV